MSISEIKRIYVAKENIQKFSEIENKDYYLKENIETIEVSSGYILPAQKELYEDGTPYFRGGVVDEKGAFIKQSEGKREQKGGELVGAYDFTAQDADYKDEEVVYCGILINHFGHFLMESINRLWYWVERHDKNLGLAFLVSKKQKIIKQFYDFMELLGVPEEKIHIIKVPTKFKKIYVPTPSHILGKSYNEKFLVPYEAIREKIEAKRDEKIYLSRRKFNTGTACYGEDILENLYKENGYKIIYPEQLELKEQISYIKGAKEIVGVIGTATHLAVFAKRGIKISILERSDTAIVEQSIIHQALQADWYSIGANMNPFPIDHSAGPVLLGISQEMYEYCQDKGLKANAKLVGQVSVKNSKAFMKEYLQRYTQITYNKSLSLQAPLIARRLLGMSKAYVPWRRKLKQIFKQKKKGK